MEGSYISRKANWKMQYPFEGDLCPWGKGGYTSDQRVRCHRAKEPEKGVQKKFVYSVGYGKARQTALHCRCCGERKSCPFGMRLEAYGIHNPLGRFSRPRSLTLRWPDLGPGLSRSVWDGTTAGVWRLVAATATSRVTGVKDDHFTSSKKQWRGRGPRALS